mgnify:CR=1 FL=1
MVVSYHDAGFLTMHRDITVRWSCRWYGKQASVFQRRQSSTDTSGRVKCAPKRDILFILASLCSMAERVNVPYKIRRMANNNNFVFCLISSGNIISSSWISYIFFHYFYYSCNLGAIH